MKTLFSFLFACISIVVVAQNEYIDINKFMTHKVIEECNGYLDKTEHDGDVYINQVGPPSFYNFDLVRMDIKSIVNEYSDVHVISPWTKSDSDSYFYTMLLCENVAMSVGWFPELHRIMILSTKVNK